jgi:hypothetical protein
MRGNSTDSDESYGELKGQPNTSVSKPGFLKCTNTKSDAERKQHR